MDLKEIPDIIIGNSSFSLVDYGVVGISLAVVLFSGLCHGIWSQTNREDFLIGGRKMRSGPVAVSTAMLYISGLAVLENPAEIYYHGIQSFMISIITVVLVPLSAFLFVSMFHNLQLTSVYQYIGHRFDSPLFRCFTSLAFLVHETGIACIMLGVVSYALEKYFQVPVMTSILGIGIFAALHTTMGGFRATIWTQTFYYFWMVLFLLVLAIVSATKAGGIMHAFQLAAENQRLELFNLQVNPFVPHNFWNFVIGYGFITLMEMVTRQDIMQRYSSIDMRRDAMKSIFMSIPLYIFPSLLCLLIGIFLEAVYAGCDPMTFGHINRPESIVPYFIEKTLSFIPGFTGFFTAVLVGSAISIYSVSINSVTACFYQDFVCKMRCQSKSNGESTVCCRFISFSYSLISCALTLLAFKFAYLEDILPLVSISNMLIFNSILYGPLAGIFLMGMLNPCTNKYGAFVGFLVGVLCTGYVAFYKLLASSSTPVSTLPPIMGECPDLKGLNGTLLLRILPWHPNVTSPNSEAIEMQSHIDDVISLSYLLINFLGAMITIVISFLVSVLTGGFCLCTSRKVPAYLLHPLLSFCGCCVDSEDRHLRHSISHRYVDRIASVHNLYPGSEKLNSRPPSFKYSSLPATPQST